MLCSCIQKKIPADDPVRLLSAFVEGKDLSELYGTYQRIRKNQATPRQLLKVVLYAAMNRIYSSRDIESSCRRDINFMYLLEDTPAPDHSTIARFVSAHLSQCSKKLMVQVVTALKKLGGISGEAVFIDGTKIESCANKYKYLQTYPDSKKGAIANAAGQLYRFCHEVLPRILVQVKSQDSDIKETTNHLARSIGS